MYSSKIKNECYGLSSTSTKLANVKAHLYGPSKDGAKRCSQQREHSWNDSQFIVYQAVHASNKKSGSWVSKVYSR